MVGLVDGSYCRCNFGNIFGHENNCKNIPWEMENDAHDKTLEEFCEKMFQRSKYSNIGIINSFRSSEHVISNLKMIINFCVNPRRHLLIT